MMSLFTFFWVSSLWSQAINQLSLDPTEKWTDPNPVSVASPTPRMGIASNRLIRYSLNLESFYTLGFGPEYTMIHNEQIATNANHGFQLQVKNVFAFRNFPVQLGLGVGWRIFNFSGEGSNFSYKGQANKLVGNLQAIVPLDRYRFMAQVEMENNLDFEEFESKKSDLFRYSLGFGMSRQLNERLSLTFWYNRVIMPFSDHYLLVNPENHVKVGFSYMLR